MLHDLGNPGHFVDFIVSGKSGNELRLILPRMGAVRDRSGRSLASTRTHIGSCLLRNWIKFRQRENARIWSVLARSTWSAGSKQIALVFVDRKIEGTLVNRVPLLTPMDMTVI